VVLAEALGVFCAEATGFLAETGFRTLSFSAACVEMDIKANMHKGKQGLKTR
jgi:hypothetical protein